MTEGSKSPSSAAKRNKGNDFMFHWGVNHTRSPKPVSKEELFYGTSEYIEHLFRSPQVDEFSPALTGSNLQTPANIDHAESLGHVDPNHVKNEHDLNGLHLQAPPISSMDILLRSKMLPSSKIVHRTFLKQKLPPHLQNMKLENTLKMVRDGNFHLKAVTNHVPQATISPVWSEQQGQNFWVIVLKQAMVLDLYFKYFIDKSVNILMRASEAVVNGDIDVSVLPATTSGSSSPSDSPSPELKFFYTKEDLHLLTCKSYVTYGRLVRELRESINKYHNEYPAKISLYWAWACYINLDADFNTFCIMIRGTLLLIHNVIMEAQSLAEVSSAIRQEIMLINDFVHATKFPDYLFDVILDLAANFRTYQQLVGGFISRYENGETFNDDLTKVLRDPLFRHECHELDKFITSCQTHYYPKFAGINNYYKERKNLPQDTNAFFVSPKLVFEMADILQNEFVNAVDDEPPTNWSHRDIVHLVSPKVAVLEHQLSSVSTQIVSAENYAFFPRILNDEVSSILIRTETERQMYALKNEPYQFDWQLGLLNHDFNPTSVISRFVNTRNHELHTQPSPSLEVIRAQINELIRSRDEIQKASERT
ncbi:CIC11C00000004511 [Sungouiella intermedia]|uniref:CIC11C00000004511 n=1 Tax=Sungouiella intermedia TaxID=45354 RepID=A0A1L0GDG4_9ASCO|nr:CIC11C00000004511 [[Candida] intermedia]